MHFSLKRFTNKNHQLDNFIENRVLDESYIIAVRFSFSHYHKNTKVMNVKPTFLSTKDYFFMNKYITFALIKALILNIF